MAQWVLSNRLWHFKLSGCLGPPTEPPRGAVLEDGPFADVKKYTLWGLSKKQENTVKTDWLDIFDVFGPWEPRQIDDKKDSKIGKEHCGGFSK